MAQTQIISQPLTTPSLTRCFREGCKSHQDLQVGVEWEKIGILGDTGKAIPYYGNRGVKAIFRALERRFGWVPETSVEGEPIALVKGQTAITLEPGGQIELSGSKARWIDNNASELYEHLKEIREVSEPLGVLWLGIGAQPFSTHSEIAWVPKDRYRIMRQALRGRGTKTFWMMKETASVQISLDYTGEADALFKLRLAMALSPVLTALFANSPIHRGKASRYLSRRAQIWHHTDAARSGILWDCFERTWTFKDYVEYALDVPMLFIRREGRWHYPGNQTFRRFMKKGWRGEAATEEDWLLHLTSIFTEARLKNYLEIRSVDCQSTPLGLAAVAFVKGLFYGASGGKEAWSLLEKISLSERKRLWREAPASGLKTRFLSGTILDLAKDLTRAADAGLAERDRKYLMPLSELLRNGRTPAERLLPCFGVARSRKEKIDQLALCAGI